MKFKKNKYFIFPWKFLSVYMYVKSLNIIFLKLDGWMTYDFVFSSTVFQSYQDHIRAIMKGCVHAV